MIAKKPRGATEKRSGSSGIANLMWILVGAVITLFIGFFLYLWNPFNIGVEPVVIEGSALDNTTQSATALAEQVNSEEGEEGYEFYELLPRQKIRSIPDEAVFINEDDSRPNGLKRQKLEADLQRDIKPDVVVKVPYDNQRVVVPNPNISNNRIDANGIAIEDQVAYDESVEWSTIEPRSQRGTSVPAAVRRRSASSAEEAAIRNAASPRKSYILQINSFSSAEEADIRRAQVLMAGVNAKVVKRRMEDGKMFYQVVSPPLYNRQGLIEAQQRLQNNGIDSLIVEQRR